MKTYTAKQVSVILDVDVQTIRRWARTGKLHATIHSKKEGYVITGLDLKEFAHNNPAYLRQYRKFMAIETCHTLLRHVKEHPEDFARYIATVQARIYGSTIQQLQEEES